VFDGHWINGAEDGAGSRTWSQGPFAGDRSSVALSLHFLSTIEMLRRFSLSLHTCSCVAGFSLCLHTCTDTHDICVCRRYDGEWTKGKFHGRGAYTFANGDQYEGDYLDGLCHGKGAYCWRNGSMYEGEWRHGSKSGVGRESGATGQYRGEWRANKIHGRGVWQWNTGTIYRGLFEMNRPTQGVVRELDGQCFQVSYENMCDQIHLNPKPSSKVKVSASYDTTLARPTSPHDLPSPTTPIQPAQAQSPVVAHPHPHPHPAPSEELGAEEAGGLVNSSDLRETAGIGAAEGIPESAAPQIVYAKLDKNYMSLLGGTRGFKEGIEVKNNSGINVFVIVAPYPNSTTTVSMHGTISLSAEGAGLGAAVHKVFRPHKDPIQKVMSPLHSYICTHSYRDECLLVGRAPARVRIQKREGGVGEGETGGAGSASVFCGLVRLTKW
jgi:hypothetical protein